MNRGMKMLLGIAVGTFLLEMAIPFAWADGGAACRGGSRAMGMARHAMSGSRRHDVTCPSQPPTTSAGPRSDGGPSHQAEGPRS